MATDYEKLGAFYLGRPYDADRKATTPDPLLYDSRDLTTHAVCVGMTGSGKTGLCLALLEEAGIDGVPAICIDPKGDLANLLLTFPDLAPADFEAWVDPADAARKGQSVAAYAAAVAARWREGLADWDQTPARIANLRARVDMAIYTPGATTGLPLSVLRSLDAPPAALRDDAAALRERVAGVVGGLLSLAGRDADPLQSREHILLAGIIDQAWRAGRDLDLASLIAAVQKPPMDKVGALDLETFFPAKDRTALAMALNNLLAAPGFAAWLTGDALDAQRLLFTPEGKPRISIISIAHLSDPERMFVVTLVLNELIGWMRRQSGTSSLRALLYMDEIFGYFPPTANPPSKPPMLTLLKQARAFGIGCVLATQNPVDLDYKGLGNTGTWFIGRLQTDRDKQRVLDGLESALPGGQAGSRATLDRLMGGLTQRVFLMRNVHDDAPVLMQSRWALSYLRGPLTGPEISRLMAGRKAAAQAATAAATRAPPAAIATTGDSAPRPVLPADVRECFITATRGEGAIEYRPMVLGAAKLHFVDKAAGLDAWRTLSLLAPVTDDGVAWAEASSRPEPPPLADRADDAALFAALPAAALRAQSYTAWGKALAAQLYETARSEIHVCKALDLASNPDESEGEFRARLAHAAREQRDAAIARVRDRFAAKRTTLADRLRRAEDRVGRERDQLTERRTQTAVSIGSALLGALFGRKAISSGSVGRAATAMRTASRVGREREDVARAEDSVEVLRQRLADFDAECEAELKAAAAAFDADALALESRSIAPRKSDIAIGDIALAWVPWRRGTDGFPAPAWAGPA
ncbi:MAG: ATP-binding protein [Steroidobacteraceae bacterium]